MAGPWTPGCVVAVGLGTPCPPTAAPMAPRSAVPPRATTPKPKPEYLQGAAIVMDNKDGSVLAMNYTLRADASGYQSFPGGVRPALPVAVMGTPTDKGLVISSTLTAVGLAALSAMPRGSIDSGELTLIVDPRSGFAEHV